MMKIISFIVVILILGCSGKPTIERFQNIIKRHIGKNISQLTKNTSFYKIKKENNRTLYYDKYYSYRNNGYCIYAFIANKDDIILNYKIITPETCKRGIPISG